MRKKYKYMVTGKEMPKKDFIHELQMCCQKVVHTSVVGYIGVDLCELDKKRFRECVRDINDGIVVIFMNGKIFERKVVM